MSLAICVAQLNPTVGNLQANLQKAVEAAAYAHRSGHQVLLLPELFLTGYAAEDLYLRPRFLQDCEATLQQLVAASAQWPGLLLIVGHPQSTNTLPPDVRPAEPDSDYSPPALNAASVIADGAIVATRYKQALPNYGVLDEKRYFTTASAETAANATVVEAGGIRLGILICEEAWLPQAAQRAQQAGAQLLVALNASPFELGKPQQREQVLRQRALETGLPIIYAHMVGGQDEVVFDGHSFALDSNGQVAGRAAGFAQELWPVRVQAQGPGAPATLQASTAAHAPELEQLWRALVLATGDYVRKSGFGKVVLGLSGGLDSALVLAIAVDALGAHNVRTVMMPSPYTASISVEDAREMVQRLGVQHDEISIAPAFEAFLGSLCPVFENRPADTTEENIQARVRGIMLMAISNKFGSMVLTTGNKSELAMGYCTLYGDMCGGFAPLKDIYKTTAFALARWRNANAFEGAVPNPIPERIITRPPSAELREGQTDQDSLPPYDVLDAILQLRLEEEKTAQDITAAGFAPERVDQVLRLLRINEYKRRQGAPGPKVSPRSFGKDWRYPIANAYKA